MRLRTPLAVGVTVLATALATLPAVAQPAMAAGAPAVVSAELTAEVAATTADVPVQALLMLPNAEKLTGGHDQVVSTLREHAEQTQAEVRAELDGTEAVVLNQFWLSNMLLVEFPASAENLAALAATPGVTEVTPNFRVSVPDTVEAPVSTTDTLTWGLEKIGAQRVWDELGVDGSGVRVATLDTGVDITHPDLAGKMVTDNPSDPSYPGGWMEFNSSGGLVASNPHDSHYHGTHVSGTIQGGSTSGVAVGVARGAELMHGLVLPGGGGSFAQVAAGMQWTVAPTDSAGNPAGQPAHVVNMSLGGNGFQQAMVAPTRAMRAAGVFPAFAIGNNCGTAGTASPGNVYEAVAVGATDASDNVASFSCGAVVRKDQWSSPPAEWPASYVKPNVSAPGVDVVSAAPGGGYRTLSGTSMATPHTAGTVALMLSAAPELSIDEVVDVLGDTAFWDSRYADQPPDTRYGIGRINAYEATLLVALDSGIEGTVTHNGNPVAGVTVAVAPGGRRMITGADGRYTTRLAPGSYDLTASAFGYHDATATGVVVTDGGFATADIALTAVPRGSITGTVTLDESGHGLPGATVRVLDVPVTLSASTGVDGTYRIDGVPVGNYEVSAAAAKFQAPPAAEVTVTADADVTADFAFSPPPDSVAIVDSAASRAEKYRDVVFAPRGIATSIYTWTQLAQAAQHKTVVLGYGLTSNYNAANFQAFLDATDANGTGVIFTDHAFPTGSGIRQLSTHTGQPASTGSNSSGAGTSSAQSYYEVTAAHPMLAGYAPGDRIVIDNSTQAKWVAWFGDYSGEGRQTLGNLGRTADGILGGGIGVDERANNRHVLLSTHGVSGTRGPADWTPEATELFLDAIAWASPPPVPNQPYFALHDLQVSPAVARVDEAVTVSAGIKNVGGSTGDYNVVLQVGGQPAASTPVTLAAGADTRVTWTVNRGQLGNYQVAVEHLAGSFRVRAPIISLSASTVDAPSTAAVSGLAGATVELVSGDRIVPAGRTDGSGQLTFEIPDPSGTYTLVVRRDRTADEPAYLLHRRLTITEDGSVAFAPRVLDSGAGVPESEDLAVRANLRLDRTDDRHTGMAYLRPAATAPHGYRYDPGPLVATVDRYEAVVVHEVGQLEQDWVLPSAVIGGLDWAAPYDTEFAFGGGAEAVLPDVSVADSGQVAVDWNVTDGHGNPFATVLASNLRPFASLPPVVRLENIVGLLRASAPNEAKPLLRLFDPDGKPVRAGTIEWTARPYLFTLAPDAIHGMYRLALESQTGGYDGLATAEARMPVGPSAPRVGLTADRPGSLGVDQQVEYTVAANNTGTADAGPLTWTVQLSRAGGRLDRREVDLRVDFGRGWERIDLAASGASLTATVASDIAIGMGAQPTWRVSLTIGSAADAYTVSDRFTGAGVNAVDTDVITLTRPSRTVLAAA